MRSELEQECKSYSMYVSGGLIEFDKYWQHIHVPVTALTFLLDQGKSILYFLQYKSWQPFAMSSVVKSTEFEHYTMTSAQMFYALTHLKVNVVVDASQTMQVLQVVCLEKHALLIATSAHKLTTTTYIFFYVYAKFFRSLISAINESNGFTFTRCILIFRSYGDYVFAYDEAGMISTQRHKGCK